MRIVLFGAAGQLGSDCLSALQPHHQVVAVTRQQVDFADTLAVEQCVKHHHPDIVVNTCAYTAVDKAQSEPELADEVNHLSVAALASACDAIDALLIHISTDYVFDGSASTPYVESSPVNPLGVYGKTKLLGEQAVERLAGKHIILRTSWVFGLQGNNFVKTMLRLGRDRDQLSVVDDQVGRPTYVGHLVGVIERLISLYQIRSELAWGIYHCSSQGQLSWCEFARAIFDMAHEHKVLERIPSVAAIPSSAYPTPAPRPMYSVLDTQKLEVLLGYSIPSWRDGLAAFFLD